MINLDENLLVLIFPIIFLVIFFICMVVARMMRGRKTEQDMVRKIRSGGWDSGNFQDMEETATAPDKEDEKSALISFFSFFSPKTGDVNAPDHKSIRIKFLQAGIKWKNVEGAFWGAKILLPLLFLAVFIMARIFIFKVMENNITIAWIVGLALLGFYLPDIWLKQISDKRKIRLFNGLPDALDLLVVCVEAGMGLDAAIHRVSREIKLSSPDLSHEFALMNLELRAGQSRQDALRNLSLRTGINEMTSLVTLLIQTDKFGTSVAVALKVFSDSFRTKRFQRAEEIAAKLPVKILIPLIFFIFPSLFVVLMGPAAIKIYENIIVGG